MLDSPINWIMPEGFDENAPGLGLPTLEGTTHTLLYDPKPTKACVDEGGTGHYESIFHGTYTHGPTYYIVGDKIILTFSNHARDEGGAGSRKICRVGTIINGGEDIVWGDDSTFTEIVPPATLAYRRPWVHDGQTLRPYAGGGLSLINDTFYTTGGVAAVPGYTTEERYRHFYGTMPEEAFSESPSDEFFFDMWVSLGMSFTQRWKLDGDKLVPDSPLYKRSEYVDRYEITPGRWLESLPLIAPYTDAVPFDEAPASMKKDLLEGTPKTWYRTPYFAPGTEDKAADGINALAHSAEYQRPDGKWVVMRDNLLNKAHFYAAIKDTHEEPYPPGIETNMVGCANPECGEFAYGRVWVIYNAFDDHINDLKRCRKDMLMSVSDDGITFEKTWLVHRVDNEGDGGVYKMGGPQYFKSLMTEKVLWVFYSITKQQIGVTKFPLEIFD
jgi:hypothetical protein